MQMQMQHTIIYNYMEQLAKQKTTATGPVVCALTVSKYACWCNETLYQCVQISP